MCAERLVDRAKSLIVSINGDLLKLKASFFLIYAVWMSTLPYFTLISSNVLNFDQLALTFTCIPATSILGPIFTGFLGDKMGNYKIILLCTTLLGAFVHLPVIWLAPSRDTPGNQTADSSPATGNETLHEDTVVPRHDNSYTFAAIVVIRILGFFALDSTNTMLDSCGLAMTKKHGGDFGKQKMFCNLAQICMPLIAGVLIDAVSSYRGFKDYSVAFYMSIGCAVTVAPIVHRLDVDVVQNRKSIVKTAKTIFGLIDVDFFFIAQTVVGICWGWHMNFFSVYVDKELRGTKTLFGASLSLSGVGSMAITWVARPLMVRIGAANCVSIALMTYGIRFIVYYFLENPWGILLVEAADGFCGFMALVAGNYYCSANAPAGMLASFGGILFAAVFGVGRGVGTTVGSTLMSNRGARYSYLVIGILSTCTSLAYLLLYHSVLKTMEYARLSTPFKIPDREDVDAGVVNAGADLTDEGPTRL